MIPDDVKVLAEPVLAHRLVLAPDATLHGVDARQVIGEVLGSVPIPSGRNGL